MKWLVVIGQNFPDNKKVVFYFFVEKENMFRFVFFFNLKF